MVKLSKTILDPYGQGVAKFRLPIIKTLPKERIEVFDMQKQRTQ